MTKKIKIIILLALVGLSGSVFAQRNGEQKFYNNEGDKRYLSLSINFLNDEVIGFKHFDVNGKIKREYKKNEYLKLGDCHFTIKDGYITGKGAYNDHSINIKDGKVISYSNDYAYNYYFIGKKSFPSTAIVKIITTENGYKVSKLADKLLTQYELKRIPNTTPILVPVTIEFNPRLEGVSVKQNFIDFVSPQLNNTIYDGEFTISDYDGIIKEERIYKNGLLIEKKEYNGNGFSSRKIQYEYKRSYSLENEDDLRFLLNGELSKNDYIETYEAYDAQGKVIASTEMDNKKAQESTMVSRSR